MHVRFTRELVERCNLSSGEPMKSSVAISLIGPLLAAPIDDGSMSLCMGAFATGSYIANPSLQSLLAHESVSRGIDEAVAGVVPLLKCPFDVIAVQEAERAGHPFASFDIHLLRNLLMNADQAVLLGNVQANETMKPVLPLLLATRESNNVQLDRFDFTEAVYPVPARRIGVILTAALRRYATDYRSLHYGRMPESVREN